ncbi:DNA-directed RNA polymerase [Candidatus Pacearchaeota archaeon]|nr:DNA-directed RNA polymerase [Candidatus Pacearchaeota archaeon]
MGRFGDGGSGFRRRDNFRTNSGPRVMHKAVCADCKQDCEVPFEPREGRPVYCKECYPKHRKF